MGLDLEGAMILEGSLLNYRLRTADGKEYDVEIGGYEYEIDVYKVPSPSVS